MNLDVEEQSRKSAGRLYYCKRAEHLRSLEAARAVLGRPDIGAEELQSALREIYPDASIAVSADSIFFNRRAVALADEFYAALIDFLLQPGNHIRGDRKLRILDGNPGQASVPSLSAGLQSLNMLSPSHVLPEQLSRHFHLDTLPAGKSSQLLSPEEKSRIFSGFADRLEECPVLHIDHHYSQPALCNMTTTGMTLEFLAHCQGPEFQHIRQEASRSFAVFDHADADILLSHAVISRADKLEFRRNEELLELIRDTAMLNDYMLLAGSERHRAQVQMLYYTGLSLEKKLSTGQITCSDALNLSLEAAEFALKYGESLTLDEMLRGLRPPSPPLLSSSYWSRRLPGRPNRREGIVASELYAGYSLYQTDINFFEKMLRGYAPGRQVLGPGQITRIGDCLCVYIPDHVDGRQGRAWTIPTSTIVRHLQEKDPRLLDSVAAVLVSAPSPLNGASGRPPRFLGIRTLASSEGSVDVCRVMEALKAEFPEARGRATAGSFSKEPMHELSVPAAFTSVARAVGAELGRLRLQARSGRAHQPDYLDPLDTGGLPPGDRSGSQGHTPPQVVDYVPEFAQVAATRVNPELEALRADEQREFATFLKQVVFAGEPTELISLRTGDNNSTFRVEVAGIGQFIAKIAKRRQGFDDPHTETGWSKFHKDFWINAESRARGIRMGSVLPIEHKTDVGYIEKLGRHMGPYSYLIQDLLPGRNADHEAFMQQRPEIYRAIGAYLRTFNAISTRGFGLYFRPQDKCFEEAVWENYLEVLIADCGLHTALQYDVLEPADCKKVEPWLYSLSTWKGAPRLAHGDPQLGNFLWIPEPEFASPGCSPGLYAGLDSERARSLATPDNERLSLHYDLSRLIWFAVLNGENPVQVRDYVLEGYKVSPQTFKEAYETDVNLFVLMEALKNLRWCYTRDRETESYPPAYEERIRIGGERMKFLARELVRSDLRSDYGLFR